jgi:hypothetical protein
MAAVNEGCRERKEAWDAYERGKTDVATRIFEGRSEVPQWDLWRSILRIFRHRSVEFIVAPYLAWSQVRLWMTRLFSYHPVDMISLPS